MNRRSKTITGLSSVALVGATALMGMTATTASAAGGSHGRHLHAHLDPLNNSGAKGNADVHLRGKRAQVDIDARGLLKGMPHAQHIHYGEEARNECPTVRDDTNRDKRLNTVEGVPAYGPIVKSLTTRGGTHPVRDALAVDRFPTAPRGAVNYDRTIRISDGEVRKAIRQGEGVIVIHGVDYNNNGKYDFDGAGKSELDPKLPAEATDPALCGILKVAKHKHRR